jgi:putative transposase
MADHGVVCSMSRSGNVWDNAAMESFFSSLKTERTARKTYRSRDEARADVFDYIERFYNPKRRHSTIGYQSPVEFERQVNLAWDAVNRTGCRPNLAIQHPNDLVNVRFGGRLHTLIQEWLHDMKQIGLAICQ